MNQIDLKNPSKVVVPTESSEEPTGKKKKGKKKGKKKKKTVFRVLKIVFILRNSLEKDR